MPLPSNSTGGGAAADLGLGDMLNQQVASQTEEQRKKRMFELQQRGQIGPENSLAVTSLFGSRGGMPGASY